MKNLKNEWSRSFRSNSKCLFSSVNKEKIRIERGFKKCDRTKESMSIYSNKIEQSFFLYIFHAIDKPKRRY